MLNVPYYIQEIKWVIPASYLLGTSPVFYTIWGSWRLFTALMPARVYEKGDELLYSLYQRLVLFFYENYTGVEIILYGDDIMQKKENAVVMCNHQCTVDWIIADMLAVRQGSIGNIRYILKDGLRYFPLYGCYFRQHSCIYVKRSGKFKKNVAEQQLDVILKNKTPFWMVVFPEGTRFNPNNQNVIEKSKRFAETEGIEPLHYHLTPRVKGMHLCLKHLRPNTDAVYDVTAAYSNTYSPYNRKSAPGLIEFLQGQCPKLHIHIKRIDIKDIPEDEEKMKEWLYTRYREKDQLLRRFYCNDPEKTQTLGEDGKTSWIQRRSTWPHFLVWTAINAPLFLTSQGLSYIWKAALGGMVASWVWMGITS